jgi:NADPH-dependent 2,4-dienoyl-CoA reductase/sulfur reductase-like enzyme/pSer/pThr/pTyr-binding forkhead associated (FHA) protein
MIPKNFVIIGDGAAGLTAAQTLRVSSPLARVVIVADDPHPAYYRAALTNYLLGELNDNQVWAVPPAFFGDYRIERVLDRAVALDTANRQLWLSSGGHPLPFDALLIASGAHARPPSFDNAQLAGVATLRTLRDARWVLETVGRGIQHAVIVGGGPLAIEWAMAMLERRVGVTLLVRGNKVMDQALDATASDLVLARMRHAGVDVRTNDEVHAAEPDRDGRVAGVVTKGGATIPCQMVGVAIGALPNTYFLGNSGVVIGRSGGIVVDDHMRTSVANIYAAGDVAEREGALLQLWQPAREQALVAAANMNGRDETYNAGAHYFATRLADLDFASIGAVHTSDGMEELVTQSQKTGVVAYRKMLLRDKKLVGALMLGQRTENVRRAGRAYKRLIDEDIDVTSIRRALLDPKFDLESWLRGRAMVTKPRAPTAPPHGVGAAPPVKQGQLKGTQMINFGAVQGVKQGVEMGQGIEVKQKPAGPMMTIGLPLATAAHQVAQPTAVTAQLASAVGSWPLDARIMSIGTDARCEIRLVGHEISHVHAQLTLHNEEHYIRDMGSEIGTWVDNHAVSVPHRLRSGQVITIGQTQLTYVKQGHDARPSSVREAPQRAELPQLVVRQGPGVGLRHALRGNTVTIGREPQSLLRLEDVHVSRRHAVLSQQAGRWFVCDMHSSRGTFKNGARLQPGVDEPLSEGDQLALGDTLLVFTHIAG